jgi:hypothetical protein
MFELRAFTHMGAYLAATLAHEPVYINRHTNEIEGELVFVTPHSLKDVARLESHEIHVWEEIHHAWQALQIPQSGMTTLEAWRCIMQYGNEIVPGFRIFNRRESDPLQYFLLLPEEDKIDTLVRLVDMLSVFSDWEHIFRGRVMLHAAGIIRKEWAYLFIGHSGAGKSTITELSAISDGNIIIHGDRVLVHAGPAEHFCAVDRSLALPETRLKALFFLVQDTTDYLVRLTPRETAKRLLESHLDINSSQRFLFARSLRQSFGILCDAARTVPGYELHFRKSPDFWNVINAELGK